ncbi:hypothetical protein GCM10010123_38510 [Pilimelia anulata]|uniref:DUF4360 domain-containing protein n=1 Tax=Pilimelia anulata TaxID=53371 RepID=A0A8J3B9U4_9ACTN|nr:DUF4360 domain-containing protein [Pilimelia anulata]GGK04814.1 hypothetical protein GCM10010123_38510 [Pilimelia anulata]
MSRFAWRYGWRAALAPVVLAGLVGAPGAPAAAHSPAPPSVAVPRDQIRVVGGEHCGKPEALTVEVSPDFTELYFLYPQLKVSAPAIGTRAAGRCDIALRLDVTPGWQVRLTDLRIQGQSTLSAGSVGTAAASILLGDAGKQQRISAAVRVPGPTAAGGWDAVSESATGEPPCDSSVTMQVNTEVTSTWSSMDSGVAHMSMTTAATGVRGANTASLYYQRCRR